MAKRSLQELKVELQKLKSVIPWNEIKADETYHVPPIISLERRDFYIIKKYKDKATYRKIGDTENQERTLHESSVFAKFLVKRKDY